MEETKHKQLRRRVPGVRALITANTERQKHDGESNALRKDGAGFPGDRTSRRGGDHIGPGTGTAFAGAQKAQPLPAFAGLFQNSRKKIRVLLF